MSSPTNITVRVLALGGKFIGSHVGYATVTVSGVVADPQKGSTDQGTVPSGQDGSGVVSFIMGQPYPWGYPVRADEATEFNTTISITEPTLVTFTANSNETEAAGGAAVQNTASCSLMVTPGVDLTGASAVVLVLQGLLTNLDEPNSGTSVSPNKPMPISAQVRMMCGCLIDNLYWPAANFNIQAIITDSNNNSSPPVTLSYAGQPSYFSGSYTFTTPGRYSIVIYATEMNGNAGWTTPYFVNV